MRLLQRYGSRNAFMIDTIENHMVKSRKGRVSKSQKRKLRPGNEDESIGVSADQKKRKSKKITGGHTSVSSERSIGVEMIAESSYQGGGDTTSITREGDVEPVADYDMEVLNLSRKQSESKLTAESKLLDVWYAQFREPTVGALLMQRPEKVKSTLEVVIGQDDRVQITDTMSIPWRWICSLRITTQDDGLYIGTGWLVGPRTVITAGHCVYIHERGGWAKSIEVTPGRNGSQRPYGSCISTDFKSVRGWTQKQDRSHDYGAIILPQDCGFGNQVGYFGYANPSAELNGMIVNLGGYPGDKPEGTIWFHARRIENVSSTVLTYNIDTAGGQSGAPVWRLKDGETHAVGIHTNGSVAGNSATRITRTVSNNIKKWKRLGS